jgi:hypothetical protein
MNISLKLASAIANASLASFLFPCTNGLTLITGIKST